MDHRAHPLSARAASRRRFLTTAATGAAALTTSLLVPNLAMTAKSMPATRSLAFRSLHTGEEVAATYLRDGIFQADALDRLNHVLRDWRSGEVWQMDRKLLDLLYALRRSMDSEQPFELISAYRSPKTNANLASNSNGVAKRSLHMRGMAVDVRLPERELKALHQAALDLQGGGVGLYTKSGFIHVDTGRVRRWGA
ncbi:MAG TPA: DUF882 domain-containing protein [Kiloniellaceae bacterium]|nr:DUF882 domain-containing protein [Kiloniellaceae bacterium]HIP78644.1 DUF882 domain-containing protein [Kiloniellaceae bacterium]